MAADYTIESQQFGYEPASDGGMEHVLQITYKTKTTPPITGVVSIPASAVQNKIKAAELVNGMVSRAVEAHKAIAAL
jgi:hypothetical protein